MSGIGAIILAAGGSSRLGKPKQLLKYKNESLLHRACNAAIKSECHPVVVVLGSRADEMQKQLADLSIEIAVNENWQRGIGSSIKVGVQKLIELSPQIDAVLIMLCDQPLIDANVIARLTAAFQESGKGVCVASYSGAVGPPVIARSAFLTSLLQLPDDRGAKEIWMQNPDSLSTFVCEEAALDIDTPADCFKLQ